MISPIKKLDSLALGFLDDSITSSDISSFNSVQSMEKLKKISVDIIHSCNTYINYETDNKYLNFESNSCSQPQCTIPNSICLSP